MAEAGKWEKAEPGMTQFNGLVLSRRVVYVDFGIFHEKHAVLGRKWSVRVRYPGSSWGYGYPFETKREAIAWAEKQIAERTWESRGLYDPTDFRRE
jgi:hypothetical protein